MFEEIIGHKEQIEVLKDTLQSGNISHAYLFSRRRRNRKMQNSL